MKTLTYLLGAAALMVTAPAQASTDRAHGLWLTANGKAIVQMEPCGAKTCGKMVWVANPKLDVNNQDPAKQGRPICGLQLIGGMEQAKSGKWRDGWIYNPRNGKTYGVDVTAVSDTELKVRGYLGLSLLGQSQTWTRVTDNRGGC